jgi:hypothetical protein
VVRKRASLADQRLAVVHLPDLHEAGLEAPCAAGPPAAAVKHVEVLKRMPVVLFFRPNFQKVKSALGVTLLVARLQVEVCRVFEFEQIRLVFRTGNKIDTAVQGVT